MRTVQRVEKGKTASLETLKALANALDINVTELLQPTVDPPTDASDSMPLRRVQTGRDLFKLVCGAKLYGVDHGEIDTETVGLVASFLQDVIDKADLERYMGPGDWIRTYHEFTSRIQDLSTRRRAEHQRACGDRGTDWTDPCRDANHYRTRTERESPASAAGLRQPTTASGIELGQNSDKRKGRHSSPLRNYLN